MSTQQKSLLCTSYFEKKYPAYIGYVYAILANLFSVLGNLFIQKVSTNLASNQVLYYVGIQLASYSYMTTKHQKVPLCPPIVKVTRMLVLRSLLGLSAAVFFYKGLPMAPLAEASVVQMLNPILTGLLALVFLKEKYDSTLLLSTVFSFTGVFLVNKPSFVFGETIKDDKSYPNQTLGLFILVICSFISSMNQILLKKLGAVSNAFTTSFYLGLGFCAVSSIGTLFQEIKYPDIIAYIWLFVLGVVRFVNHALINLSFTFGDASKVSLISYSQVPLAFIIDIFIVGRNPDIYSILGSFSVFSSVFAMMYKNYKQRKIPKK